MKNKYIILLLQLCFFAVPAFSQTITVTGIVSDDQGPLEGVSIVEKAHPQNGTTTNVEGKYSITVQRSNSVLVVSATGYLSAEQPVNGKNNIDIVLETDTKGLEEIVVVGYGRQKKVNVTGAVSTISRADIMQTPSASIQNALTGKLTGFFSQQRGGQPGRDGAQFFVRGVSTFASDQSPLILVDDIESTYEDFSNIDPNEVENISILKDAATTAVYGIKGANGVVLVTTRRGKQGSAKINLRTEYGIQKPVNTPKLLDAATTAELFNEALKNDAIMTGGTYTPKFSERDIQLYRDGTDPYGHPNINWYDQLIRKSTPMTTNNLDISGGTERVKYFLSLGYLNQQGLLKPINAEGDINNNYNFDRYNFRSNLDISATKSLNIRLDISGNNTVLNAPRFQGNSGSGETAVFYEIYHFESLQPFVYPIYNPDGTFGAANSSMYPPNSPNIIGRIYYGGYTRQLQNLLNGAISATQKLDAVLPGLELRALVSVVNGNTATRTILRNEFPSYFYNSETGVYTPFNANIYRVSPFSQTYNSGSPRRQTTIQANLSYNGQFGKHNINSLLLFSQNSKMRATSGEGSEYSSYIPVNLRGYTGRLAYNYANKYMLEFNGAYNGSTVFDKEHRWDFFPAYSFGWNINEENFFKNSVKFINQLKLRGSLGTVGSDNIPDGAKNAYQESYVLNTGSYSFGETHNAAGSIVPGSLGNNDVRWEKERKANIGLEFAVLKSRLTGTVDVFSNLRYDILTTRNTIPFYFGIPVATLPLENIGKVSNKGYEVELAYKARLSKNTRLNVRGTYTYAKNRIEEIDEVPPKYPWRRQTGQPIGSQTQWIWDGFYSVEEANDPNVPKYTGASTTVPGFLKYRDLNGDGVISDDDKGYFGNPNLPTTVLGLNTNITYKNFSFTIFLQSALDYDVQIGFRLSSPFMANLQEIHLKRWTPETAATAEFPALVTNFVGTYNSSGQNSDFWAISGNYLRIRSAELSYKLPDHFTKKIGLNGVRVYANGYNLYTWSKTYNRYGLDPEVARGGNSPNYQGPYPQMAIYNLGLNISIR
ncbi:MAG: TonB-dependent receptor [Niabella sp.]